MHRAGVAAGHRVLVVGAGAIGLCAVAAAQAVGATVHVAELHETRLARAALLGATVASEPVPGVSGELSRERAHAAQAITSCARRRPGRPARTRSMYAQLGARSRRCAVGRDAVDRHASAIELADLQERLASSHHPDITAVYQNLLRGSGNHLRAYVNQWERATGQTYQPQVLDAAAYAAIVGANTGNGNGRWGAARIPGGPRYGRWQP